MVDPGLLSMLDAWPKKPIAAENLPALRDGVWLPEIPQDLAASEGGVSVSQHVIEGPPGAPSVLLRCYRPVLAADAVGCAFHIHGGGFVCGSSSALELHHRRMTSALGCAVVTVDYRLAPETTFPGAIEDCYAGLAWVFARAGELGIDPDKIGVAGESTGGGLAAALALLARDRGELKLSFQHMTYPMLDDRICVKEPHRYAGEFVFTLRDNRFCWTAFLGRPPGSPDIPPYAAPSRAANLAGLPPTFMSTAALDLFVEENIEYAGRLMLAGVPVELHVYPGCFHGFDLHPTAAISLAARRDDMAALGRFLGRQ